MLPILHNGCQMTKFNVSLNGTLRNRILEKKKIFKILNFSDRNTSNINKISHQDLIELSFFFSRN
jgi:hypothetical protein